MCYGDIDHGSDGYYRQWAEQRQQDDERQQIERELEHQAEEERND